MVVGDHHADCRRCSGGGELLAPSIDHRLFRLSLQDSGNERSGLAIGEVCSFLERLAVPTRLIGEDNLNGVQRPGRIARNRKLASGRWPGSSRLAITSATADTASTDAGFEDQRDAGIFRCKWGADARPDLSPLEVVRAQLDALRRNSELGDDKGIATAFRFASPANRAVTGPLDRFIGLLKNPLYRPMLDHSSARFGPVQDDGEVARLQVVLFGRNGEVAAYDFTLSRDEETDCWLTDGVSLSPVEMA